MLEFFARNHLPGSLVAVQDYLPPGGFDLAK